MKLGNTWVIDDFVAHSPRYAAGIFFFHFSKIIFILTLMLGNITLTAGTSYQLLVEYFQGTGGGKTTLYWSSACLAEEVIPKSQLDFRAWRIVNA